MKKSIQKLSMLLAALFILSSCGDNDNDNNVNPNTDPNLMVFTNQTGDSNANALQAQYTDTANNGIMDIYGTFNADGTPKQISNLRYRRINNDSVVNVIIDETTGRPSMAIMEVNGTKENVVTEFSYTDDENEIIVSFYDHNWNDDTNELIYSAKYFNDDTGVREEPIFIAKSDISDYLWGAISVGTGFGFAELAVAVGGGISPIGTGVTAVTAAVSAVGIGTIITVGLAIVALDAIINTADASELEPQDEPYPDDTMPDNPIQPSDEPNTSENPCIDSNVSLTLGLDPGNEIVAIASGSGSSNNYTFYWSTGEVTDADTFTSIVVDEPGTYTAMVVDSNGCAGIASIEVDEITDGCDGMTSFTDPRDGQTYAVVEIGNQCWMAENLNYSTGNSWCYDNDPNNCNTYGRLYYWQTALTACPDGWHLPSDAEWTQLTNYLGGEDVAGGKMKSTSSLWEFSNTGATNSSGFSGLPGGFRFSTDSFSDVGHTGNFLSSTEDDSDHAWTHSLHQGDNDVDRNANPKTAGFSCRCLKD